MNLTHIRIIGSGLIGSSIGLALVAKGLRVTMIDLDSETEALARDLIGEPVEPTGKSGAELTIIASPLSSIAEVLTSQVISDTNSQSLNLGVIDISSVKVKPKVDISALGFDMSKFLPSHPMAGREVSGAESARADLFQGCTWIIDSQGVSPELLQAGRELIELCGAHCLDMPALEHDQAVALVSHLPQIMSSLLAATLEGAPAQWLDLAGSGLRDTTRIAASKPALWGEIIAANNKALLPLLESVATALGELIEELKEDSVDIQKIEELIQSGNRGRSMIPGKHGGAARNYSYLPVVIEDKPGQLAALFDECARAQVNVEDLAIEHSPEQYTGLITLALSQSDAERLHQHLLGRGWKAHPPR